MRVWSKSRKPLTYKEEYRAMTKPKFKSLYEIDDNTGAYLYKTDACCDRFKNFSRDELGDYGESISEGKRSTVSPYGNLEWARERFNVACAYSLKAVFDLRPELDVELDVWVSNYKHLLSDEMVERKELFDRIRRR